MASTRQRQKPDQPPRSARWRVNLNRGVCLRSGPRVFLSNKVAQPRSSEKNTASRAGQPPCARWAVGICYTIALSLQRRRIVPSTRRHDGNESNEPATLAMLNTQRLFDDRRNRINSPTYMAKKLGVDYLEWSCDHLVAAKRRPPKHHHLVVFAVVAKRRPQPSRRCEAAAVTTITASSWRSDDHPAVVAKRRPRPSRRRKAASRP